MLKSDYLKVSLKKTIRNKNNLFTFISIILCSLVTIGVLLFEHNFNSYIDLSVNTNYGFRTLSVPVNEKYEDYGLSNLKEINHVIEVYDSLYDSITVQSSLENKNLDGYINLVYGNYIDEIKDYNLESTEENVAICPKKFYPSSTSINLNINDKYFVNENELIGKTFDIKYSSYKIFKDKKKKMKIMRKLIKLLEFMIIQN